MLEDWQHYKKITITGSSGAGTGCQVLLKVGESSGASGCDFHVEGHSENFPSDKNQSGDLRFTDNDGETLLPFWVEKVEGSSPNRVAYVWVKVADNLDSSTDIFCYYGNSSASNVSNGDETFEFFDDFEQDTVGNTPSRWIVTENPSTSLRVSDVDKKRGSKSALLDDDSQKDSVKMYKTIDAMTRGVVEYDLKFNDLSANNDGDNLDNAVCIQVEDSSDNWLLFLAYGDNGSGNPCWGYLFSGGSHTKLTDKTFSLNTWYKIGLWFDTSNDVHDLYVDDAEIKADISKPIGAITKIIIGGGGTGHTHSFYIDSVRIRKWTGGVEPAFSSAGEEQNTTSSSNSILFAMNF